MAKRLEFLRLVKGLCQSYNLYIFPVSYSDGGIGLEITDEEDFSSDLDDLISFYEDDLPF